MPKVTVATGIVLVIIGLLAFFLTGHHPHSFIPMGWGLLLAILGALANTPEVKKRALIMHIAVTVGLLGFLGTVPGIIGVIRMALGHGTAPARRGKGAGVDGYGVPDFCAVVCAVVY